MDPFLALAVLCALTTVIAALIVRFSGPVAASKLLRDVLDRIESVEDSMRRKKIELEGLAEAISIDKGRAVAARNRASALERKQEIRDERDQAEQPVAAPTASDYEAALVRTGRWGSDA